MRNILILLSFLFLQQVAFSQSNAKNKAKFPKYQAVGTFHNGLAKVKFNNKWGFIDTSGVEVIPPRYHEVGDFNDGLARVRVNEKWGMVDTQGNVIIKPTFEWIYDFEGDRAKVLLDNKTYYMNRKGQRVE